MRARAFAAVVVAVYCGLLLGGLAARIAWNSGEKPVDTSLAQPALVMASAPYVSDEDLPKAGPAPSEEGWLGALPAPKFHTYLWRQVDDWPGALDTIHERLVQAGWQVGARVGDDLRRVFWAAHDGHLLRVLGGLDRGDPSVILQLHRTEPPGVLPAAIAGFLLGGVATWFAARSILRRRVRPGWARLAGGVGVVFAGALSTLIVVGFLLIDWWATHDLLWPADAFASFPEASIATFVALGGYAVLAIRCGSPPE
jgi:hypothetical protein